VASIFGPNLPDNVMASSVLQRAAMLLLNRTQRAMLVDKLPDVANLAIGALSFGQFLADRPFSLTLGLCGLAIWVVLMAWAISLASGGNEP
jgi:Na+-transporting methylmalonyl-CoA/oxaloacetate decarboxylase beta subunit